MTPWVSIEVVPRSEAFGRWQTLRGRYEESGAWPLIVADADELPYLESRYWETRDDLDEVEGVDGLPGIEHKGEPTRVIAPAPGSERMILEMLAPGRDALIVTLLCQEPGEAPAALIAGGDAGPQPDDHLKFMRRWEHSHGAEPIVVGWNRLVLLVRPIQCSQEAHRVAQEMAVYCAADGIEEVADQLIGFPAWFFWWD